MPWLAKLIHVPLDSQSVVVIGVLNPLHSTDMSASRYMARIDHIRDLAPNVRELTLCLVDPGPSAFHFLAGQSIAVEILLPENQAQTVRYYSLASPSIQSTRFTLLLSLADQGVGATYLFQQSEGAMVQFQGPHGTFHLQEDKSQQILFIATGTGIAPFLSMLSRLLGNPSTNPVTLYWGLRSERDLYYQAELQALADQHSCFSFVTTLSRAHQGWSGATGRVTELVARLPSVDGLAVYVCGHQTMVNEVSQILREKGDCPIYREQC